MTRRASGFQDRQHIVRKINLLLSPCGTPGNHTYRNDNNTAEHGGRFLVLSKSVLRFRSNNDQQCVWQVENQARPKIESLTVPVLSANESMPMPSDRRIPR